MKKKNKTDNRVLLSFRFHPELVDRLKKDAKDNYRHVTQQVEMIIADFYKRNPK